VDGEHRVPYRVHSAMNAMKTTRRESITNRATAEAEIHQLAPRDDPVLFRRDRGDQLVRWAI
jgi:hypothetical protein